MIHLTTDEAPASLPAAGRCRLRPMGPVPVSRHPSAPGAARVITLDLDQRGPAFQGVG